MTTATNDTTGPTRPAGVFFHLIVTFLTSMFLSAAGGDIAFARQAAIETVNAYSARGIIDLLPIAQIIAFGLAVLGSLSLSMEDDLSIPCILRLRGNAVSLNRGAEKCRRALLAPLPEPAPNWVALEPEAERPPEEAVIAEVAYTSPSQSVADLNTAAEEPSAPPPAPNPSTRPKPRPSQHNPPLNPRQTKPSRRPEPTIPSPPRKHSAAPQATAR